MDRRSHIRAVGARLAIGADALFLVGLAYACFAARSRAAVWPDTPDGLAASATLPFIAVGCALLAAGLVRVAMPRILGFLILAASLGVMALFFHDLQRRGISIRLGTYGAATYIAAAVWTTHVIGAFVYFGLSVRAVRASASLSLYLAVVAVAGALAFSAVLL